jgi:hypothetical protein
MPTPHAGISPSEQEAIAAAGAEEAATQAGLLALKADKVTIASQALERKIDAKGATDLDAQVVGVAPFAGTITAVELVLNAAVTGDTTNTRSFVLTNKGQTGVGTTSLATLALITNSNVAMFDAKPMVLSVVANALVVAAGDVLSLAQTVGAAGLAHSGGIARVVVARS